MAKRNSKSTNKQVRLLQKELGGSGTSLLRGFLREDYVSNLQWPQSVQVYEKMIKGDAQVRASVKVCQLPIMAATWSIPAKDQDDDPILKEAGEFIDDALFKELDFAAFLNSVLGMLPYGYSIFEKVFKVKDNMIYWDKFAWRKQNSIYKWEMQDGEKGVTQDLSAMGGGMVSIPAWKLLLFSHEKEGDNYAGTSILRSAYKHWYMKDTFYKIDAIAFERNGIGILKITLPEGHLADDLNKAEELGENFYANEQQYIVLPNEGWKAELLGGAENLRDPKDSISHHNREITKNVLAQFLELGSGSTGSFALNDSQSNLFYISLESICNSIIGIMNEAIRELCEINGYNLKEYPELEYSHVGTANYERLAAAISSLSSGGFLTPDKPTEAHLRNLMQFPEADEDTALEEIAPELSKSEVKEEEVKEPEKKEMKKEEVKKKDPIEDVKTSEPKFLFNHEDVKIEYAPVFREYKPYRKLYKAEQNVKFKKFNVFFNEAEQTFVDEGATILNKMIDGMISRAEKAIDKGKIKDIGKLSTTNVTEYKNFLKSSYKSAYDFGKIEASDELGVEAMKTPQARVQQMNMTADAVVDQQSANLELVTKTIILAGIAKELAPKKILFDAKTAAVKKAETMNRANQQISTIGQISQARMDVHTSNLDKIQKVQYSAVIDNRTTDWCSSLDGRVVDAESPDYSTYMPGQHFGCRSVWIAIMAAEPNPPESQNIGKSIPTQTGGPENFKDLDRVKEYTPKAEDKTKLHEVKSDDRFNELIDNLTNILNE